MPTIYSVDFRRHLLTTKAHVVTLAAMTLLLFPITASAQEPPQYNFPKAPPPVVDGTAFRLFGVPGIAVLARTPDNILDVKVRTKKKSHKTSAPVRSLSVRIALWQRTLQQGSSWAMVEPHVHVFRRYTPAATRLGFRARAQWPLMAGFRYRLNIRLLARSAGGQRSTFRLRRKIDPPTAVPAS
jgi:hypothetical protein